MEKVFQWPVCWTWERKSFIHIWWEKKDRMCRNSFFRFYSCDQSFFFFFLSLLLLLVEVYLAWISNYALKSIYSMVIYWEVSHRNDMYVQILVKWLLSIAAAIASRFIHTFHISSSRLICPSLSPAPSLSSLKLSAMLNRNMCLEL